MCSPIKLDSNPCWLCVAICVLGREKKRILELMHREREKKKLADSNQVQSLWVMHLDDCIHAC